MYVINFYTSQLPFDRANSGIYSILAQMRGIPPQYSPTFMRRQMVITVAQKPSYFQVRTQETQHHTTIYTYTILKIKEVHLT